MVENRLAEENEAKRDLAELYDLGVDNPEFDAKLSAFARAVLAHAEHEEKEEFALLRQSFSGTQLTHMANTVRGAEATAPTRPHPHAGELRAADLVAGPPLAVFARARRTAECSSARHTVTCGATSRRPTTGPAQRNAGSHREIRVAVYSGRSLRRCIR